MGFEGGTIEELAMVISKALAFIVIIFSSISSVYGQSISETIKVDIVKTDPGPKCADFTNLNTNNVKIINSCGEGRTVRVVNYDRNGVKVADRIFHLNKNETRSLDFPGYQMLIDWDKKWASDCNEDGTRFLSLTSTDVGDGSLLWEARNISSDRFNAINLIAYVDTRKFGEPQIAIAPGQKERVFYYPAPHTTAVGIDWACLDPK